MVIASEAPIAKTSDATVVSQKDALALGQDNKKEESMQTAPQRRMTITNPFAKVCPSCGVENSSYRTECFNCGVKL
jgi:hypothetical protein